MISILLSCYQSNQEYLGKQIDSILAQTEKDWELLIYNDGTIGLLEFLISKGIFGCDNRVQYFDEGHRGYTGSYNFLLQKASGDYVCFCDHDDIWEPDKLEIEKKYLDEHPDVDCVFGWLHWFGEKEKIETFSISDDEISKELYFWQPIKQPTAMFRRLRFGSFDAPFDTSADFWFYAKHKDRHYHLIEKVLVNYRRHPGEATKDKSAFRETTAMVIRKNLHKRLGVMPSLDVCKMLDRYSKTYNEQLKQFVGDLCK